MMYVLMVVMSMLLTVSMAFAGTAQITYTEPSTNVAGNPLTNLKETTLYWKQDAGPEQAIKTPSALVGGAAVAKSITIVDPPLCGTTTITAQVSASNTNATNFESARSAQATGSKSNIVPGCTVSNAPTGLTITIQ